MRPIVFSTPLGALAYALEGGRTIFPFKKDCLVPILRRVRKWLDREPEGPCRLAAEVVAHNEWAIDMDACGRELVEAIDADRARTHA